MLHPVNCQSVNYLLERSIHCYQFKYLVPYWSDLSFAQTALFKHGALTICGFSFVSLIGSIGFMIATHIKARSYPSNLLLLGGFTLCEAYGVGVACSAIESEVVVQALLITFVIFIGLTLFAFQTKYDFISWQGTVMMATWVLIGWGFIFMVFPNHSSGMEMLYSGLGAIIFSIYIIIDTQRIMKTVHLDDEVPATLSLYLDILNLFLFVLRILNNRND